jgi:hypothetical protein
MDINKMKAGRYRRMYVDKKLYNEILTEIARGLAIQVTTYTKSKIYTKASQFRLGRDGVYVQRGKNWDCIRGASVRSVRI